jgi:sugar phosphate isomerase/epimerase
LDVDAFHGVVPPPLRDEETFVPELTIALDIEALRLPFSKALHTAAQLGVRFVEIDARDELSPQRLSRTGLREVKKMLADANLRVVAVDFRARGGYTVLDGIEPRIEATKAALELAGNLGASFVVNAIGRVPGETEKDARQLLLDVLGDLGRHGQRVGAMLAAETGSEAGTELGALLAELGEGMLGVDLNPGRLVVNGFSPQDAVRALGRHVVHVHLNDARSSRGAGFVALGHGDVDIPALLATLDEQGYGGCFTVQPSSGVHPVGEVAEAIAYLRAL